MLGLGQIFLAIIFLEQPDTYHYHEMIVTLHIFRTNS